MTSNNRSMFGEGFTERHDLEQYFWTEDTVRNLVKALDANYIDECCCLTTPSLAHALHMEEREEVLLDIDKRFDYIPKFRYFDIRRPTEQKEDFRIIVMDPPFFYIPMEEIFNAVVKITKGDFTTKIMIGFLIREEATLMKYFSPFGIKRTRFPLKYATVKPNKWTNYALYSNVDLPGIKRINPSHK